MKVEVWRGGSGKWVAWAEKRDLIPAVIFGERYMPSQLCGGHVPKAAPFEEVCRQQIIRQASSDNLRFEKLGGGSKYQIEVPDEVYQVLLSRLNDKRERKERSRAAETGRDYDQLRAEKDVADEERAKAREEKAKLRELREMRRSQSRVVRKRY